MVEKLTFVQNQTEEGTDFTITDKKTGNIVVLTAQDVITTRFFTLNNQILQFSGSTGDGKVTLPNGGNDGVCRFMPDAGDMDTVGTYKAEVEIVFDASSRTGKIQDMLINIIPESPTS